MSTGLENELLGDTTAPDLSDEVEVKTTYSFLEKIENGQGAELTPAERVAYKIWLGIEEEDDPFARLTNPFDTEDQNLVDAYEMLGMDFPEPPTHAELIAEYEEVNGEGSFKELGHTSQSKYLRDNYAQEPWDYETRHAYYNTIDSYDSDSFGGYDDEATYTYRPGLDDNGNSGYQNLRPWDSPALEMTTGELRTEYRNSGTLQSTFASEDDFLNYVAEMNAAGLADPYASGDNNLGTRLEYEKNPVGQAIFSKYASADGLRIDGYTATNAMGDTFEWTGSSWMPVDRAYRPSSLGTAVKGVVTAGLGAALSAVAGPIIGSSLGVSAQTGSKIFDVALSLAQGDGISVSDAIGIVLGPGGEFNPEGAISDSIIDSVKDSVRDAVFEDSPEGLGDIVWDATDNDGEDAAEGVVNEDGDFVFEGGDVPVTIPDYSQDVEEEDEGGGGASESGGDASGGSTDSGELGEDAPPWGWVFDPVTGEWNPIYSEEEAINLPGSPDISVGAEKPGEDYYGDEAGEGTDTDEEQEEESSDSILPGLDDVIFPGLGQDGDFTFGGDSTGGDVVVDDGLTEDGDTTETGEDDGLNEDGSSNDGSAGDGISGDGVDGDGDDGTGEGDGGDGSGDGGLTPASGMLSGGSGFEPEWGELFAYTTLTPYQKKVLEPLKNQISTAKGMLT